MKKNISIIIPAYNEEHNIQKVISDLIAMKKKYSMEIIVVDDGSIDKTSSVAKKLGADIVLKLKKNRGKGFAFAEGIKKAQGEYIIQIDADYQFQPSDLPKFIRAFNKGFDICLGTRYQKGSKIQEESVNFLRLFGSYALSLATSFFVFQRISDVMAGFKGFRADVLKSFDIETDHFGYEAEVVIKGSKKGYKITNIPITYKKRPMGKSSVQSFKHGYLVLATIIRTALRS